MNKKVRQLYCMDLLVANPESDSLANLQKDIEAVRNRDIHTRCVNFQKQVRCSISQKMEKIWRRWKCVLRSTPATI